MTPVYIDLKLQVHQKKAKVSQLLILNKYYIVLQKR